MISAGPMPQLSATKIRTGLTSFETLVDCLIQQYERQAALNANRGNRRGSASRGKLDNRANSASTATQRPTASKANGACAPHTGKSKPQIVAGGRNAQRLALGGNEPQQKSSGRQNQLALQKQAADRNRGDRVERVGEARSTVAQLSLGRQTQASFSWYQDESPSR